jgi:tetratricopeptide (TPR) repeat protein
VGQIGLLFRLYVTPLKAISRILDEGRLIFAVAAAIAVLLAIQLPRAAQYEREQNKAMMRFVQERIQKATDNFRAKGEKFDAKALSEETQEYYADLMAAATGPPSIQTVIERFVAINPTRYLSPLAAMAICFVPIVILVLTRFESIGSFSMVVQRDYSALLLCTLLSWSAAYFVLLVANGVLWTLHNSAYNHPGLWWAAHAYFLLLTTLAIRTITGTRLSSAVGAVGGGFAAGVGGIWLYAVIGNPLAYVASPCLLYYLYTNLAPGVSSLGGGLGARQRLKHSLQNATVNPRDADAHYQLGLIYAQRRQFDSAIESFRKAVEVDPNEPEAHYQLGRIAREQGRFSEALRYCRTAAHLDDKHSSSEVWREIGIASFLDGDLPGATHALEKYLDRRPYDPEALCWYGRTMASLNRAAVARDAFQQAIEAVRTMPPGRRRQLRSWESEAARELKKLQTALATHA